MKNNEIIIDKRSRLFFLFFLFFLVVSVGISFYKMVIIKNYTIFTKTEDIPVGLNMLKP